MGAEVKQVTPGSNFYLSGDNPFNIPCNTIYTDVPFLPTLNEGGYTTDFFIFISCIWLALA